MAKTYATLCIYSDVLTPSEITQILEVQPSRTVERDGKRIKKNGWFLSTKDVSDSISLSDHIALLLEEGEPPVSAITRVIEKGCDARVYAFWSSSDSNGGPVLTREVLRALADAGVELHFDIWPDEC